MRARCITLPLLLVFELTACRDREAAKPADRQLSTAAPTREPERVRGVPPSPLGPLGGLSVTINGNPAGMDHAFIKRIDGGEYQFYATNRGGSCRELIDNSFNGASGEVSILANVGRRLAPSGAFRGQITDVFIHGFGKVDPGSTADVVGSADAGSKALVTLAYTASNGDEKLGVKGTFSADGCGERAESGMGYPKVAHASTAKLTVAGHDLPLKGAAVRERRIVLSSNVVDCSPSTPRAEAVLRHEYGRWELSGAWFETESSASDQGDPMSAVNVTPGKKGSGADGPTVELRLAGAGKVGDYAVSIGGAIEALDCEEPTRH